jgi:hypothetical protein
LKRQSRVIPHLQEHLLHVGNSKRPLSPKGIFVQRDELADRDLIGLDGALLGDERAHVADKISRDIGWEFYRLAGLARSTPDCSLKSNKAHKHKRGDSDESDRKIQAMHLFPSLGTREVYISRIRAPVDAIYAADRQPQSLRPFLALSPLERKFPTDKFIELIFRGTPEMLAWRLRNRFSFNHRSVPKSVKPTATRD